MKITTRSPLCFSEIGRKDNQEDYLWPQSADDSTKGNIFLMCDGVGGQDSGELASRIAATSIGSYLSERHSIEDVVTRQDFEDALNFAYDELDKNDTGALKKMGTTMTCLVLHKGGALMAHIGDSRVYHIRPSLADKSGRTGIVYQTSDHSLVNDLLKVGDITEEEAANFSQKNVITRAMQPNKEHRDKADIFNATDVQEGDFFFLCCDGVLEQLTNRKLGEILADTSTTDEEKLMEIKSVCDGKTKDNYTCWLIPIDEVEKDCDEEIQTDDIVADVEVDYESNQSSDDESESSKTIKPVNGPTCIKKGAVKDNHDNCKKYDDKTKTKTIRLLKVIIILLVVLIAIGAGLLFYQGKKTKSGDCFFKIERIFKKSSKSTSRKHKNHIYILSDRLNIRQNNGN